MVVGIVSLATSTVLGIVQLRRGGPTSPSVPGPPEAATDPLSRYVDGRGRLPMMGEPATSALALRVHRAIPLPLVMASTVGTGGGPPATPAPGRRRKRSSTATDRLAPPRLDEDLPTFVERERSAEVTRWMAAARATGGFLVLVGDSAVGKTRLLYEAARETLPDYAVLAPTLGDGAAVNAVAGRLPHPKLLVWLDDLQRFLDGPYLTADATALRPDAVRRLLNAPEPVILVGTLWPEYAANLRATGAGRAPGKVVSLFPHAADILDDARLQEIRIDTFSADEKEAARQLGVDDPRLARAASDPDFNVTEVLAGAREIVRRYDRATAAQRAILDAAIDARRVGIESPLSAPMLAAAARGYLREVHPDDSWFDPALAELTRRDGPHDRGAAPVVQILDDDATRVVGHVVADYLLQRLRRERRTQRLPRPAWLALVAHCEDGKDLARLARSATNRLRYDVAEAAHRKLNDLGRWESAEWLVSTLRAQSRNDEAVDLLRRWVDAGHSPALTLLITTLQELRRIDDLNRLGAAGDVRAKRAAVDLLIQADRRREAIAILRTLAGGDGQATWRLIELYLKDDQADAAIELLNEFLALSVLGNRVLLDETLTVKLIAVLAATKQVDTAAAVVAAATRNGWDEARLERRIRHPQDTYDRVRLVQLLVERGDLAEAERSLATRGYRSAPGPAIDDLMKVLRETDQIDEAIALMRDRTDALGTAAMHFADLLLKHDRMDILKARANSGDPAARKNLTAGYAARGMVDEIRKLATNGDTYAIDHLVAMLLADGDTPGALALLRAGVQRGDQQGAKRLVDLLARSGMVDELRELADAGVDGAVVQLTEVLIASGDVDGALEVLRARTDDPGMHRRFINTLRGHGRMDELRQRAGTGDRIAEAAVVAVLIERQELDDAIDLLVQRVTSDQTVAPTLLQLLVRTGQVSQALTLARQRPELNTSELVDALLIRRQFADAVAVFRKKGNDRRLADALFANGEAGLLGVRADAGDQYANRRLVDYLMANGDEDALRRRCDAGDWIAGWGLATILLNAGRVDDAIDVLQARSDAGDRQALRQLIEVLVRSGRIAQATDLIRTKARAGDQKVVRQIAKLAVDRLIREGHQSEVNELLAQLAGDDDFLVAQAFNTHLVVAGDLGRLRLRADAGDRDAAIQLIDQLAAQADLAELEAEVVAGTPGAATRLIQVLGQRGETERAKRLRAFGLESQSAY